MPRFTMDNTDGYTQEQLDEFNDEFDSWVNSKDGYIAMYAQAMADIQCKSYEDYIAEDILARFDARMSR